MFRIKKNGYSDGQKIVFLYRALPESSYGLSLNVIFAQSSYFECITDLQRVRFVTKNRTVLALVTSVFLCVMCSVCFGSFGNRGITQIVGIVSNILVAEQSEMWVCGRWPAEIVGSSPSRGMDVFLW